MLQSVAEFAVKTISGLQPGFGPKKVKWRIDINQDDMVTAVPYGSGEDGGVLEKCPEYPSNLLQGGGKCHFLVETLQVMLLLLDKKDGSEKYQAKNQYFVELLRKASISMIELKVAAYFFSNPLKIQKTREILQDKGAKPIEKAFFTVQGVDPLRNNACLEWWANFRNSLLAEGQDTNQMLCFLSGNAVSHVKTHPKISGLKIVGGRGQDILVGFDKKAFESFTLKQSANCAMSEDAVNQYAKGLDSLIRSHSRMLASAKVVHWFKEAVKPEDDPLAFLYEPPELTEAAAHASARKILESLRKGQRPVPGNNRYFAMTISGASGRVMVRD